MPDQTCSRTLPVPFLLAPTNQEFQTALPNKEETTLDLWGSDLLARKNLANARVCEC